MTIEEFTSVISAAARIELDDPQTSFTAQGLDSLGLLNVLVAVEDSYSIEIDPASFADGLPRTPAEMHAYAESMVTTHAE